MYAVVKTGGKQYKVEPGTVLSVEKLSAEVGEEVELPVIFVADGDKIEADPAKAASTKVIAEVLEQYKGQKQLVFKFKKRKGYKKLQGHRQQLTKVRIVAVGAEKYKKQAAKVSKAKELVEEVEEKVESVVEAIEEKAEELAETVEEKAEEAAEAVEEKAEDIAEAAREAAEDAAEEILDETAGDAVEEAVEEAASEE